MVPSLSLFAGQVLSREVFLAALEASLALEE
jgi:hypothetical protein